MTAENRYSNPLRHLHLSSLVTRSLFNTSRLYQCRGWSWRSEYMCVGVVKLLTTSIISRISNCKNCVFMVVVVAKFDFLLEAPVVSYFSTVEEHIELSKAHWSTLVDHLVTRMKMKSTLKQALSKVSKVLLFFWILLVRWVLQARSMYSELSL